MPEKILQRAKELEALVKRYAELRQHRDALDGFKTRRDLLREIAVSVHSSKEIREFLIQNCIPVQNNGVDLKRLLEKVTDIYDKFTRDPSFILQPNSASLTQFKNSITNATSSLLLSWRRYAAPGDQGEALVAVLDRYAPFRDAAARIRLLRQQLAQKAEELPSSDQVVSQVNDLKKQLTVEIQSLSGKGLDESVLDFLRRSATGVPLGELFLNPQILKWIQDENLIGCFQVTCN